MSYFLDTNIIIRLLTQDDPTKAEHCRDLFRQAERGEIQLVMTEAVVLEAVQVLSSPRYYRMDRRFLATVMQSLLQNRGVRLEHKTSILQAFDLYATTNLDFADCLYIEHARREGLDGIYSYDRDFDRVQDISRLEP